MLYGNKINITKILSKPYITERKKILEKLSEIFEDVLDLDETPTLTDATSANDIEEWDSLSHIQLIVAIEKEFKLKFTSLEIMKWNNVGEMVDSMMQKLG